MTSSDIEIGLPNGSSLPAYFALSKRSDLAPGVVLLQEIFGVNDNMREIADHYATRGINAIAPDLFWRQEPGVRLDPSSAADRERATELMKGLDRAMAVKDALAAAEWLRKSSNASGKVGAVGYCLGGKLAYLLSMHQGIDAAVSYYGVAIQNALDKAGDVQCPLLLHIAEEDHLCPPAAQAAISEALGSRPEVAVLAYSGVGHAFARRGGAAFDPAAAKCADGNTEAFLLKALDTSP